MPEREINSEEVDDILSALPHWTVRHGIMIVWLLVVSLASAAWFVEYPRTVSARVTAVTQNPPLSVVARSSGGVYWFLDENGFVRENDRVAAITNTANVKEVLKLRAVVETFGSPGDSVAAWKRFPVTCQGLGELQPAHAKLARSLEEFLNFERDSPFAAKRKSLEAQLANKRSIREILTRQRNLAVRELELVDRKREMYGKLRTDGLVSDEQLIGLESERTAKRAALAGMENSLLQNEIGISEYETNAADLERQAQERRTTLLTAVRAGFEDLRNELAGWEDRYVLRSPTSGHVSRVAWADGQHVNSGDEVFVVVPNSTELIGWVQLPQAAAGPVKVGQTVRIEFDNFPRADFGCVTALVEAVSLIPREEKYQVRVGFPRGMLTDLGKQIDFRQEMQGNAEVVVEKGRLSDRLTSSFRALF